MENFQDRGVWIRIRSLKNAWIRIRFVLRGWIRIRSISDLIRNPECNFTGRPPLNIAQKAFCFKLKWREWETSTMCYRTKGWKWVTEKKRTDLEWKGSSPVPFFSSFTNLAWLFLPDGRFGGFPFYYGQQLLNCIPLQWLSDTSKN